jgi:hypothetical protein
LFFKDFISAFNILSISAISFLVNPIHLFQLNLNPLLIVSSFLMITACGGGGGDSTGSGEVSMSITDAKPLLPDGVTNLWITFTEVLVHKSGGGWESLPMPETPYTIGLLQFHSGDTTELVPPVILVSGKYTQIRLVIDEEEGAWIRFDNDDNKKYPVIIPPEHLKTDKNFDFDVKNDAAVDILIDFDLSQSIVVTDDGSGPLSYKLKPVLHIVDASEAATITGAITDQSFINFNTNTANIAVLANGEVYTEVAVERDNPDDVGFTIFWLVPDQDYIIEIDMDPNDNPGTDWQEPVYRKDFSDGEADLGLITIPPPLLKLSFSKNLNADIEF